MRLEWPIVALAILSFAVVRTLAQEREKSGNPPDLTFRSSVQEISLDLSVRDQRGRQVKNLKPEDVEIYENGVRQQLRSFRFVDGRESVSNASAGKSSPPARPNAANPLPAVNYVCVVFHNLDSYSIPFAVDAAKEFLDRELRPGTGVGLFALGAKLSVLRTFTTDRKDLTRIAVQSFAGTAGDAARAATPYQYTVSVASSGSFFGPGKFSSQRAQSINGADVGGSASLFELILADLRRTFNHIYGMEAVDQLDILLNELGPLPGRKSVLLFSPGLVAPENVDLFEKVVRRANLSQISIYAVDVNGLSQNSGVVGNRAQLDEVAKVSRTQSQAATNAGDAAAKSRQGDMLNLALRGDTQETLRALSEGTGGFLVANSNDLRKPFQHLMEDVDTHYEATYSPSSPVFDGRFRKIEVKLARANLNVQSRVGYYALPALGTGESITLSDMIGLAALNAPDAPHPFDFRADTLSFHGASAVALSLPGSAFTTTALPGNRHQVRLSVLGLVKDASGQVVHKFSQETPLELPDAALADFKKSELPFSRVLDLAPGRYTAETAVADLEGSRVSVRRFAFEVPEAIGLDVSSVMLVHQLQPPEGRNNDADPFLYPVQNGEPEAHCSRSLQSRAYRRAPIGLLRRLSGPCPTRAGVAARRVPLGRQSRRPAEQRSARAHCFRRCPHAHPGPSPARPVRAPDYRHPRQRYRHAHPTVHRRRSIAQSGDPGLVTKQNVWMCQIPGGFPIGGRRHAHLCKRLRTTQLSVFQCAQFRQPHYDCGPGPGRMQAACATSSRPNHRKRPQAAKTSPG